ncbi:MAG: transglycosylase domain-containing protein [Spirochaetales bacterium]|nr:transglycosylase domain-containing protein [Spirochaetales bacterium]
MWPYPEFNEFGQKPFSLHILDRNGTVMQILALETGERREYIPLTDIPPLLVDVFIKAEDARFYSHGGYDIFALLRALDQNVRQGEIVSGASTITMQLARLISPHGYGYAGKVQEIWNALFIEARMNKDAILELWLNSIPFGYKAIGVASASKIFFGVPLNRLSPAEFVLLALIPRSPVKYSPFTGGEDVIRAASNLAERIGLPITAQEIKIALEKARIYRKQFSWPFYAPHFVNFVAERVTSAERAAGRPIRTSLDLDLTIALEAALAAKIESAYTHRIHNGAGIILDNATGEILAYVGSQGYFDSDFGGQIDGIHIRNQPGSTLKPYLYALALTKGFTAASVLPDIPSYFGGEEVYIPLNFNERFNGPVRLRVALASSLNIPAVYLLERLGVKNFTDTLIDVGFDSIKDQTSVVGIGLALGNAEVSLYELTKAFALFPRAGKLLPVTWRRQTNFDQHNWIKGKQVYDPITAGIIRDILSDKTSRVMGFGPYNILNTDFPAIFKTGTSNQFNNIWAIGATPRYTMGVWMGNFSGETVIGAPGSSLPAQVVVQILKELSDPDDNFPNIENAQQIEICTLSGGKATPLCPSVMLEYFPPGVQPEPCTYHIQINGQIVINYPPEYQIWAAESGYSFENIPQNQAAESLHIVHPGNGAVFFFDPSISPEEQAVSIEVIDVGSFHPINLFLNGNLISTGTSPLKCNVPLVQGLYTVYAEGVNASDQIQFEVR